jgi:hypothetical protein
VREKAAAKEEEEGRETFLDGVLRGNGEKKEKEKT